MAETWRPFHEALESYFELVALARVSVESKERKANARQVSKAAKWFQDVLDATTSVALDSVRFYRKARGGMVPPVVARRHAIRSASYSDEAVDLMVEHFARLVDLTGECYVGYYDQLDPGEVAKRWGSIAGEVADFPADRGSFERLKALIREEHESAPHVEPRLPFVFRSPGATSILRRRAEARARRREHRLGPAIIPSGHDRDARPTDQIFFVPGEPEERSATKVGGLPYRPAGLPWPVRDDGEPMSFLAQFCLADSRDLLGRLPGNVLLIFAEGEDAYLPNPYGTSLRFEWYPTGLGGLVEPADIPRTEWSPRPEFGVARRTLDGQLVGFGQGETKVGGEPSWIQAEAEHDGRFLCSLGRLVSPPVEVDRWGADTRSSEVGGEKLVMQDAGCLYFFIGGRGAITWSFQSH